MRQHNEQRAWRTVLITVVGKNEINRPVEEVFDYVADVRNELQWNPTVISMEKVSADPVGLGTLFVGNYKQLGRAAIEIVEYERPRRLALRAGWKRLAFTGTFDLRGDAHETEMRIHIEIEPSGFLRLLVPLMASKMRKDLLHHGELMTRALEQPQLSQRTPVTSRRLS